MPKIVVHDQSENEHVYEGGNLKVQAGPGCILVVDFDHPVGVYNTDFVEWIDILDA